MDRVNENDIVQIAVVTMDDGRFGVSYVTSAGDKGTEPVSSKEEASAMVSRVGARLNTSSDEFGLFERDTAAS